MKTIPLSEVERIVREAGERIISQLEEEYSRLQRSSHNVGARAAYRNAISIIRSEFEVPAPGVEVRLATDEEQREALELAAAEKQEHIDTGPHDGCACAWCTEAWNAAGVGGLRSQVKQVKVALQPYGVHPGVVQKVGYTCPHCGAANVDPEPLVPGYKTCGRCGKNISSKPRPGFRFYDD